MASKKKETQKAISTKGQGSGSNPNSRANLKPIKKGQLSKDELKKRQKNGGKKSAQVRKAKKTMAELAKSMLEHEITIPELADKVKKLVPDADSDIVDYRSAMIAGVMQQAIKGNHKAFMALLEATGEKKPDIVVTAEAPATKVSKATKKDIKDTISKIDSF